jgi:two-component system, response regulator YesN
MSPFDREKKLLNWKVLLRMYKLMIVEDEEIEREGLRDLVDWKAMGIEVVAAMESGEKALKAAKDQKIDILLTDIKMGGISGLELARRLLPVYPDMKVIITSGYQEFEYAKTAIDVDAYGFLSKPIDLEELEKVFSKVLDTCMTEENGRQENERLKQLVEQGKPLLKEKFLNNLIAGMQNHDTLEEDLRFYNIAFVPGRLTVIVSEIDGFAALKDENSRESVVMTVFKVLSCIQQVKTEDCAESFYLDEGRYCTLYSTNCDHAGELYEKVMEHAKNLQQEVNEQCRLKLTVGIGKWVDDIVDLQASYKTACDAVGFKFYMGGNQVIFYKDACFDSESPTSSNLDTLENKILSAIQLCDTNALHQHLDAMFELLKGNAMNTNSYIRTVCIKLIARTSVILHEMHANYEKVFGKEQLIWDKLLKFDTIMDIQQWMKNILGSVIDYILQNQKSNTRKVINDVLRFIDENYSKNIAISDISKEIFLSSNYISILFRKEMGENFTDYLARYRLEKAKELLRETKLKVYQIGNMVGYSNISHFCMIFKSMYGVSPSEYREKV